MIFKPKNVCIKYDMNSVISQSGRVENAVVLHLPMQYISVSECSIYSTENAVYIQPLMQYIFIFQGYDCLQEFIKYNSRHLSQGSGYCEKKTVIAFIGWLGRKTYLCYNKKRFRMNGYLYKYLSPLGDITLASNGESLTGLWFDGQKYFDPALTATYVEKELPVFVETLEWLERYFNRELPGVPPALQPQGSPFRQAVWNILKEIPYGQTVTYKDIAQKLARQKGVEHFSAQAVGGAIGHNPISILIPCHRVIGSNGNLTGYAGGLWRKEKLLELEREHFLSRNA